MKCGPNSKYKLFAMFIQASLHGTRGMSNLATTCQALARVLACLYLSAKLSTPLHAFLLNSPRYTVAKGMPNITMPYIY